MIRADGVLFHITYFQFDLCSTLLIPPPLPLPTHPSPLLLVIHIYLFSGGALHTKAVIIVQVAFYGGLHTLVKGAYNSGIVVRERRREREGRRLWGGEVGEESIWRGEGGEETMERKGHTKLMEPIIHVLVK